MFETRREKKLHTPHDFLIFEIALTDNLYEGITAGQFSGIGYRIADKIAEELYPEVKKRVLEDPKLTDGLIADILLRIANRLSKAGLLETEASVCPECGVLENGTHIEKNGNAVASHT